MAIKPLLRARSVFCYAKFPRVFKEKSFGKRFRFNDKKNFRRFGISRRLASRGFLKFRKKTKICTFPEYEMKFVSIFF